MSAQEQMERAFEAYRKDQRFRMIADSCVAMAHQEHGRVDPERADRAVNDIATRAVVLLLQRIYEEDAELNALKWERDQYRRLAEDSLKFTPPRILPVKYPLPKSLSE